MVTDYLVYIAYGFATAFVVSISVGVTRGVLDVFRSQIR